MLTIRVKVNLLLLSLYKTYPVNEQIKTHTNKSDFQRCDSMSVILMWRVWKLHVNNHDVTVRTSWPCTALL